MEGADDGGGGGGIELLLLPGKSLLLLAVAVNLGGVEVGYIVTTVSVSPWLNMTFCF